MNPNHRVRLLVFVRDGITFGLIGALIIWINGLAGRQAALPDEVRQLDKVLKIAFVPFVIFLVTITVYIFYLLKIKERERKEVERELTDYSARLQSFIEIPDHVSIYSVDREYRYTGFNSLHQREMKEVFGVDIAAGKNILELIPEELGQKMEVNYKRVLKGEHFTNTREFNGRFYRLVFNPVYNGEEIVGLTSNIFDVTESIEAEQELEHYKEQLEELVKKRTEQVEQQYTFFQKIIDHLPTLIFVRDENSRYVLVNQATADSFGCTKEELIGKSVLETHRNKTEAMKFESEDAIILENGSIVEEEAIHPWPDGSKKWLLLNKRKMEIANEKYVLGVHFDITYLKETEVKLQLANDELMQTLNRLKATQLRLIESEKMASLGQLTAGLAHEINNPINYVAGNVEPIRKDIKELRFLFNKDEYLKGSEHTADRENLQMLFDELDSLLGGVEEGTTRVKSLMNDLYSFSTPENSDKYACDVNESIRSTVNLIRHHLKDRIVLREDLGEIPLIWCSPKQLNQVFLNILNNAIQAITAGGEIMIKSMRADQYVVITIQDSGAGIPREHLPRIFDPFFTTKDVGEGTGLGLSISYRIVEDHKGVIEVESIPGKGSTFMIRLPVEPA